MTRGALSTSRPTPAKRTPRCGRASHRGTIAALPGRLPPLSAMAVEDAGFEGVYVSGAALSADLGLPDVGPDDAHARSPAAVARSRG